jgi:hypothetical protein
MVSVSRDAGRLARRPRPHHQALHYRAPRRAIRKLDELGDRLGGEGELQATSATVRTGDPGAAPATPLEAPAVLGVHVAPGVAAIELTEDCGAAGAGCG